MAAPSGPSAAAVDSKSSYLTASSELGFRLISTAHSGISRPRSSNLPRSHGADRFRHDLASFMLEHGLSSTGLVDTGTDHFDLVETVLANGGVEAVLTGGQWAGVGERLNVRAPAELEKLRVTYLEALYPYEQMLARDRLRLRYRGPVTTLPGAGSGSPVAVVSPVTVASAAQAGAPAQHVAAPSAPSAAPAPAEATTVAGAAGGQEAVHEESGAIPLHRFVTSAPAATTREKEELADCTCAICGRVTVPAAEPRICTDEHVFCKLCIRAHLDRTATCPVDGKALLPDSLIASGRVAKSAGRLVVRCARNRDSGNLIPSRRGCLWRGPVTTIQEHEAVDCVFLPIPCPRCGVKFPLRHRDNHTRTCGATETCEYCGEAGLEKNASEKHLATCPAIHVPCPNVCLILDPPPLSISAAEQRVYVPRGDLAAHLDVCPNVRVTCPFSRAGCSAFVTRGTLAEHERIAVDKHLLLLLEKSDGESAGATATREDGSHLAPRGVICKNSSCAKSIASLCDAVERNSQQLRDIQRAMASPENGPQTH